MYGRKSAGSNRKDHIRQLRVLMVGEHAHIPDSSSSTKRLVRRTAIIAGLWV